MEKIIFLDLDGVLIRFTQKRFGYNLVNTKNECINKYGETLNNVNPYDLGAMYYDFNAESIASEDSCKGNWC